MDLDKKSRIKSYIYDGIVIFVGVFLSFFVEDLRVKNLNDHRKIQYLKDSKKFQSPYWVDEKKLDKYMLPSFTKKIVKYLERN